MVEHEPIGWLEFCQWLFAQPASLHALQALKDMTQFRTALQALAASQHWQLSEAQLDQEIQRLQISWLHRCL